MYNKHILARKIDPAYQIQLEIHVHRNTKPINSFIVYKMEQEPVIYKTQTSGDIDEE